MVKIDVEAMEKGAILSERLGGAGQGLPWFTILAADGQELANSTGPNGNIGCPVRDTERAHFVSMITSTVQRSSPDDVDAIAKALEAYAATLR